MARYENMTQEEFDTILRRIAYVDGTDVLLDIPGVWECVSEFYNNDVLEVWENEQDEEEEEEIVPDRPQQYDTIFDPETVNNSIILASPTGYINTVDGQDPDDSDVWIVNGGTRIVWEDSCWQIAYDKEIGK